MSPEMLKWIEERKPMLVGKAEEYVKQTQPHKADSGGKAVTSSQLRNLLAAAQAGQSVPLLVNLLRYQMGRRNNAWAHTRSGEALLALLPEQASAPLAQRFPELTGTPASYAAQARVAALLLGYIVREFTYCAKLEHAAARQEKPRRG